MKQSLATGFVASLLSWPHDWLHATSNPGALRAASPNYHLTARPWEPIGTMQADLLDVIEGLCRFAVQHLDEDGALIDPFLEREHQYATPYFVNAAATLIQAGRALDLLEPAVRAMDHATKSFEGGNITIPDQHGEFFIAPLAEALDLFDSAVDESTRNAWRARLRAPVEHIIEGLTVKTNNWRTYAMKGEWTRYRHGLIDWGQAVTFIEDAWVNRTQRERIASDRMHLYQDWNGHPQSHAVEAVGRGNLLALVEAGYDGPSADAIRTFVEAGTEASLLLQDPSGQCPPNGRTDDHVFNDVLYQLIFDVMTERRLRTGDADAAGRYRRAANLALRSIQRWRRDDVPWQGSFYITKNHFDPGERVGYQPASQYGNYSGAVMYHLAEAYRTRLTAIEEIPAPTEIGGYAVAMDERFGSVVANAGGMQVFANLRGDTVAKYDTFWTPLGVVRFARAGWDSRLGPSDGARDALLEKAITFGPAWQLGGQWIRLAMAAEHYQGTLRVDFVHPLLVRYSILYAPVTGVGGPNFYHDFVVTPDGVLTTLHSPHDVSFGLTLPLLENDGRNLTITVGERIAGTRYPAEIGNGDEQYFIVVNDGAVHIEESESVRSSYGWLRPARVTTEADRIEVFVYPRSLPDPTATDVLESFQLQEEGFTSPLGRVQGSLYIGRFAAGGVGDHLDLTSDGVPDVRFETSCGFIVQHEDRRIVAIETDTDIEARLGNRTLALRAYEPATL